MPKVALLIDGDNVSSDFADDVINNSNSVGDVMIRRVYGNQNTRTKWGDHPFLVFVDAGDGKNGADLLLAIDAMDFAARGLAQIFVIVSSDGDFSHLAHRLRELGHNVHGMGEAKAPVRFARACMHFEILGRPSQKAPSAEKERNLMIRDAINSFSKGGSGALIVDLGNLMRTKHKVQISAFPERRWRVYFDRRPKLFEVIGKGNETRVRYKPEGFSQLNG